METIIEALEKMEKASAREIAARMKIEPRDALGLLREHEELGQVQCLNGCWFLSEPVNQQTCATPEPERVTAEEKPPEIDEQTLVEAIKKHGPQTAEELAGRFGVTSRKIASTLAMGTSKGRLKRVKKQGGKFCYCLPEQDLPADGKYRTGTAASGKQEPAPKAVKLPAPAVTARRQPVRASVTPEQQNNLHIPDVRDIAREIRRTRHRLAQLEKMRNAANHLRRNHQLLLEISKQ